MAYLADTDEHHVCSCRFMLFLWRLLTARSFPAFAHFAHSTRCKKRNGNGDLFIFTIFRYLCGRCSWRMVIRQVRFFRCLSFLYRPRSLLVCTCILHATTPLSRHADVTII